MSRRCAATRRWCALIVCVLIIATTLGLSSVAAQNAPPDDRIELELRIALGGGSPQSWRGQIHVPNGEVELVRVLGLEPDTPAGSRVANGRLEFAQRSPHAYDGFDVVVRGPRNSSLNLELSAGNNPINVTIPLTELISGVHNSPLDEQQNRLLVRRTPGDRLRLVLERDSLVFDTGETLRFSVQPHEAGLPTDTALRCRVRLLNSNDEQVWSTDTDFRVDRSGVPPTLGPYECTLPGAEGVYRVAIEIIQPPRLGVTIVRTKPLAARDMQLVAISMTPPAVDETPLQTVLEIDPAHPGWLDRLSRFTKLTTIPGFANKEPLGNGQSGVVQHNGAPLVQLAPGGWQAYPLPLKNLGQPHVLEVEYPGDELQALGISIVEPNAAGQIAPLGVDSGVLTSTVEAGSGLMKHRLVFWPRTKTPLVLLTNRHPKNTAIYGKLQVLAGPSQLPSSLPREPEGERLVAAYYDRPLFAENFGAGEALDQASNRTLDDWNMYFLGARRLIEELKYAGYNGAILSVACEGSALYPSELLEPTPKYDMGTFFASGQDPLRKDILEMLFRLFDREGLQLVPAVQFATPLIELEQQATGAEAMGLHLLGPDGNSYVATRGARRGLAPYYNPLDERVRLAMRRVVDELAERYAQHTSFAGVSLQLSPDTFAQLPGEEWGYDDRTIERFARETHKTMPGSGPTRFAQRARQLQGPDREAWLDWRAKQMASLYTSMQRDLQRHRGNARLYLAGGEMLHSDVLERQMRPTLPAQAKQRQILLSIGIDPQLLRSEANIVFLRPQREFAPKELAAKASHLELNRSTEFDEALSLVPTSGVHLFHEPATLRLAEFDAKSPFGADKTHLFMASQLAPSGAQARRGFVRSVAAFDAQTTAIGGWMLPLGQEDALREVLAVYRQLPAVRFESINSDAPHSQPVVVRQATHDGRTYVYLANPSPWPLSVKLDVTDANGSAWTALGGRPLPAPVRQVEIQSFTIQLAPHDLFALQSPTTRARVVAWQTTLPEDVPDELRRRINLLRAKAIALRSSRPLDRLTNADFESAATGSETPGWIHATNSGIRVGLDRVDARGKQALHVQSNGPVAWVRSEPFAIPTTGRLSVWVWLKVKDPDAQPPLRLAIEARHRDKTYYRFASVGAGAASPPLKNQWAPYLFQVDDLPTSDITDLRVGFDLMGEGDIWIDDVQVFDLYFHEHEQDELLKMIALADLQLDKGHYGDCQRMLEGYWARFIDEHVPAPPLPRVADTDKPSATSPASDDAKTGLRDRMWNWMPKWR